MSRHDQHERSQLWDVFESFFLPLHQLNQKVDIVMANTQETLARIDALSQLTDKILAESQATRAAVDAANEAQAAFKAELEAAKNTTAPELVAAIENLDSKLQAVDAVVEDAVEPEPGVEPAPVPQPEPDPITEPEPNAEPTPDTETRLDPNGYPITG